MTRPLRSPPTAPSRRLPATTGRSASAPRPRYSAPCGSCPLGALPVTTPKGGGVGVRLPTFRAEAADQAHVAFMPDTIWPRSGHPPDSSRAAGVRPGFDATCLRNDTSTATPPARGCAPSSWSPPGASRAPFPPRSPRRSSANAAGGGLKPPPAGRLRRAYLHLLHSTASTSSPYIEPPSTFVAHLQPEIVIFMAAGRLAVGSGRHERGLAGGVATTTSATGGRYQRRGRRPGRRTGAGSRCRSTG